jgi:hypothetical protein
MEHTHNLDSKIFWFWQNTYISLPRSAPTMLCTGPLQAQQHQQGVALGPHNPEASPTAKVLLQYISKAQQQGNLRWNIIKETPRADLLRLSALSGTAQSPAHPQ